MKKLLALILAAIMVCSMGTTAFAAEITNESEMQTGYSEIVYNLDTSYCIEIPEQIDATVGAYTFTAAYVNLSETEQVVVRMSGVNEYSCMSLQNANGDTLDFTVMYDNATIVPGYVVAIFTDSVTATGAMRITPDTYGTAHRVGQYSGVFEFTVSVETRA